MRRVIISILVTAIVVFPVLLFAGSDIPNLKGKWTGKTYGIKYGKGDPKAHKKDSELEKPGELVFTMAIDFQDKRVFSGIRSSSRNSERILGVISSDNKTLYFVDEDGYLDGRLLGKDKMEVVYREVHPSTHVISICIYDRIK